MEFSEFIAQNMHVVAAALYVLGLFLKSVPKIPDWTIPFALTVLGAVFGVYLVGFPDGLLQGVLCAGAAVLVNQLAKQAGKAVETKQVQD
ncbi:MAG: phage holin family protein [Clostridia bacterium]|nr:phage holin family protein [Clostridia bacterium]